MGCTDVTLRLTPHSKRSKRIAMIVSPWYPVPPTGYGGIELMAYLLATELQQRGHEVSVIGQHGSKGQFESLTIAPERWVDQLGTEDEVARSQLFLYRAYQMLEQKEFDIVHDNAGLAGMLLGACVKQSPPVVATVHGPTTAVELDFLRAIDRRVHLVAISHSQQNLAPGVNWRGVVHNAVDPTHYTPIVDPAEKEDYLVQLARISPDKGQRVAIEVAQRLGMRLVLAGKVDDAERKYFESEISPHLGDSVVWIENVAGEEKRQLLAHARAMLFPIQWDEPFGIAMIEAMVSGTPVIATARGSANEVVEPGVTGWLADDAVGMVGAFSRLGEIDLRRCVESASFRFGPARMADGYEGIYERAIAEMPWPRTSVSSSATRKEAR